MRALALAGALVLDGVAGQPRRHPVRAVGALLGGARRLRRSRGPAGSLAEGAAALALVSGAAAAAARLLGSRSARPSRSRRGSAPASTLVRAGREAVLLHPALALEALIEAGEGVGSALRADDLAGARRRLARDLVSRDTGALEAPLCASAAIESMAENLCDSVVGPACSYLAAGLPGAWTYRVVNTADAMLGYRTAELLWYGKPAARSDDLLNLVPARLTAVLIAFAAGLLPQSPAIPRPSCAEVLRRLPPEAGRAAGPNAGWPMAAAALVLGVRLRKPGAYTLNAGGAEPGADEIHRAGVLIRRAAWLGAGIILAIEALRR